MLAVFVSGSLAQPAIESRADAAISELLSYSVPAEDWQEHLKKRKQAGWVPPPLPSSPAADTSDIKELACYWQTDSSSDRASGEPSATVRERLLTYCEEHPENFESLAGRFSASQDGVVPRIRKLHDRLAIAAAGDEEAQATLIKLRHWLMAEAGLFREELKAEAERYFTAPDDTTLQAAYEALQKLEPSAASALLLRQAAAENPLARTTSLLWLHTMKDAPTGLWREELQKIVTRREVAAVIRARALKGLGETEWPGKTEWVMSLFDDAGLGVAQKDKYNKEEPLALLVKSAPDLWVPKIVPLVGSPDRVVHDNAVRCLIQFEQADALRPLLPWLSNPKWALMEEPDRRKDLIYALRNVNLPESVPGLLWALDHDSEYTLMAAVSALVHYRAVQGVPQLRKAVEREPSLNHRRSLAKDLLDLGGVPLEEQVEAVVQYSLITVTKDGREALQDEWMSPSFDTSKSVVAPDQRLLVTTGWVIEEEELYHSDALTELLARRVEDLRQKRKMDLAEALESRISLWFTPAGAHLLAARLRAGRISADWLWQVFSSRSAPLAELEGAQDLPPNTAAVVAVLLKDTARMRQILAEGGVEAQAMLLACARLQRTPLPLDKVMPLLKSKHILCARGAERYLEAEDSAQARAILLRRFKGEARILGARMSHDPGHFSYGNLGEIQDLLRKQVLAARGPLEIHALLSAGYWGDVGQVWVEVEGEKAMLVNDQGGGRFRTRSLAASELAELRSYLSKNRVDDLPPLTLPVDDGIQYEYVHLTAEGGRRVFMNNPGTYSGGLAGHGSMFVPALDVDLEVNDSVYVGLVRLFQKLMENKSGLKVAYRTATPVRGLKIVIPHEQKNVRAVMEQNGVLMVHAVRPGSEIGRWVAVAVEGVPDKTEKTWKGPVVTLPNGGFPEGFQALAHLVTAPWLSVASGGYLRPATREKDEMQGLWLCREKQEPELIVKGVFASPITSLDGQWAVAARVLGRSWAEPNDVVRINLATREAIPLKLAAADDISTITRLPGSGNILIRRTRDEHAPGIEPEAGPEKAEYHLLDPATGKLERVKGEFGPLQDESWRPLQPASQRGVVWAAVPTYDNNEPKSVKIGRYDLRTFAFTKVMEIPGMHFTSMDLWVDEKEHVVYLAVNGDLLSIPLPENADK
jgi:hypothetical protein